MPYLKKSLKTEGLFWTSSAGLQYNDLQGDFKEDLEDNFDENEIDDYSIPKYINIPVLVGLQYEKSLSSSLSIFGEGGLGVNLLKITNLSASIDDYESKTSFKPSVGLGYKIGGGILLNDKYTIGLSYLGLGSYKVKYEQESESGGESSSDDGKFDKALPVASLNVSVGIRF